MKNSIELKRVKNDINGNPRYVAHFFDLMSESQINEAKMSGLINSNLYNVALKKSRRIGGKAYRGKDFGGGIVFTSYNVEKLINEINDLKL